jgi:DNA-binding transcriptional MocR family regulator
MGDAGASRRSPDPHAARPDGGRAPRAGLPAVRETRRLRIDPGSATPLYQQVAADLRRRIVAGALPVGARVPPHRELAQLYDVSLITINKALAGLVSEGVLHSRVGRAPSSPSAPRRRRPRSVREPRCRRCRRPATRPATRPRGAAPRCSASCCAT